MKLTLHQGLIRSIAV